MRRKTNRHIILKMTLVTIFMLFLSYLPVAAQYDEDVLKAAYIERITRFVEWPLKDKLFTGDNFVIGVYDEKDFYNTLLEIFKENHIKNLKVKIIQLADPDQIRKCNLCYLSERAKPEISKFVTTANSSGVLLFSETPDFSKSGVHINFYIEDEKLKFEINEKSILSAGFKVSYLLMQNTRKIQ
jgi:hypothetical protein